MFLIGDNDANNKLHPWGLAIAPGESIEAFEFAFSAYFKYRSDVPPLIGLFMCDGSQAIETAFYQALHKAVKVKEPALTQASVKL